MRRRRHEHDCRFWCRAASHRRCRYAQVGARRGGARRGRPAARHRVVLGDAVGLSTALGLVERPRRDPRGRGRGVRFVGCGPVAPSAGAGRERGRGEPTRSPTPTPPGQVRHARRGTCGAGGVGGRRDRDSQSGRRAYRDVTPVAGGSQRRDQGAYRGREPAAQLDRHRTRHGAGPAASAHDQGAGNDRVTVPTR